MEPRHRWLILATLAASLALAVVVEPPNPLESWLPERLWQVATLAAGIFLAFLALLTILDLVPLKLTLLGSEVGRVGDEAASALAPQLADLRHDTREIAGMVREAVTLVRDVSDALVGLERRVHALEHPGSRGSGRGQ